jgi:8-oxo-dGTP diphosphatase
MKKKIYIGVLGLAINKKGQYLLTKRYEPENKRIDGKWQLPGGGVDFGETVEQTLAREMEEELRVSARIIFPYPIVKSHIYDRPHKGFKVEVLLLCYLVDIGGQTPHIGDPESSQWGWFSPPEAQKLDYLPLTIEFITEAEKIIKKEKLMDMVS